MSFEQRMQSATLELLDTISTDAPTRLHELKRERGRRRRERSVLVAGVLALVAAGWFVARAHDPRPPEPVTPHVRNGALVTINAPGVITRISDVGMSFRPTDAGDYSELAFTSDGRTLVYANREQEVVGADVVSGRPVDLGPCPSRTCDFTLSPDERTLVFGGDKGLRARSVDSVTLTRLTDSWGYFPAWSPDGTQIAYIGEDGIYTVAPDGQATRRLYAFRAGENAWSELRWSPDGRALAFLSTRDAGDGTPKFHGTEYTVMTVASDGSGARSLASAGACFCAGIPNPSLAWSPDGSRIAFSRVDSGSPHDAGDSTGDGTYLVSPEGGAVELVGIYGTHLAWQRLPD